MAAQLPAVIRIWLSQPRSLRPSHVLMHFLAVVNEQEATKRVGGGQGRRVFRFVWKLELRSFSLVLERKVGV